MASYYRESEKYDASLPPIRRQRARSPTLQTTVDDLEYEERYRYPRDRDPLFHPRPHSPGAAAASCRKQAIDVSTEGAATYLTILSTNHKDGGWYTACLGLLIITIFLWWAKIIWHITWIMDWIWIIFHRSDETILSGTTSSYATATGIFTIDQW
jgi:hypothetical protein